jgi:integrase
VLEGLKLIGFSVWERRTGNDRSVTFPARAPKTIDHVHGVLIAVLRTAVKWGHLQENPARGVDLPALKTVRPKWVLTTAQAAALLQALPRLARTMVGLAVLTGLRRGELFALRWKAVDLANAHVTVREAFYEGTFGDLLGAWKTGAKRIAPEDLVFSTWSGKPISPNNVLRRWVFPACATLGMPKAKWLTFRRTYSSWAHEKESRARWSPS